MRNTPCCNQPGTMDDGSPAMAWTPGGANVIQCHHCKALYGPVVDAENQTALPPSLVREATVECVEKGAEYWVCYLADGTTIGVPVQGPEPKGGETLTLFGHGIDRPVRAIMRGDEVLFDAYDDLADSVEHWRTRCQEAERVLHAIDDRYGPLLGGLDAVMRGVGGVRRQLGNLRRAFASPVKQEPPHGPQ